MNTEKIKKVSLIIPTHNKKKILARTLDYLMVQDYR
ncbi:unnamed protein product, partial [marine sediment metagenome]